MILYLRLAAAVTFLYLYGACILCLLGYRLSDLPKRFYLVFCFGSGGAASLMFLAGFIRIPLSLGNILLGLLVLSGASLIKLLVPGRKSGWGIFDGLPLYQEKGSSSFLRKSFFFVFPLLMAGLALSLLAISLREPDNSWDASSYWLPKAKAIYLEQGIYSDYFHQESSSRGHPYYPLLTPLVTSHIYFFLGGIDNRLVRPLFLLYFLMLLAAFFDMLRHYVSRETALAFTAFLSAIPRFLMGGGSALVCAANIPLAFYCFILLIFITVSLKERKPEFIPALALVLYFCAFTKLEGLFYGMILLSGSTLFIRRPFFLRDFVRMLIIFGALYAPWFIFRNNFIRLPHANFPAAITLDYVLTKASRLAFIIPMLIFECLKLVHWHITWFIFTASLFFCLKNKQPRMEIRYLWVVIGGFFAFFVAAYMLSSWWGALNDEACKALIRYSGSALFSSLIPIALFCSALSLESSRR